METELFYLFFARTADMCLATLRHLVAVRGRRVPASAAITIGCSERYVLWPRTHLSSGVKPEVVWED